MAGITTIAGDKIAEMMRTNEWLTNMEGLKRTADERNGSFYINVRNRYGSSADISEFTSPEIKQTIDTLLMQQLDKKIAELTAELTGGLNIQTDQITEKE